MRPLKQLRTFDAAIEAAGLGPVAGVDEAGRGACCGPLTAAACILPPRPIRGLAELNDSKQLSASTREKLFEVIAAHAVAWSVVHISARDIDRYGIHHMNISAMRRAVAALSTRPGYVLSDGYGIAGVPQPQLAIIGGDAAARSIAAASILAKVSRDRLMDDLDRSFPGYGLAGHKGYGTAAHIAAVRQLGATAEHRMSYRNIARAQEQFLAARLDRPGGSPD